MMCRRRPHKKVELPGEDHLASKSAVASDAITTTTTTTTTITNQCFSDEGPVIACIRKWREELGLCTDPLRSELEEPDFSKPIVGIKDLRQFSRMHSATPTGLKHNDFAFTYCIRRDQRDTHARYNPYDLEEVGAKEAQGEAVYYTVSAHCVTQVSGKGIGASVDSCTLACRSLKMEAWRLLQYFVGFGSGRYSINWFLFHSSVKSSQ